MNLTMIGSGYVGLVTGACFAEWGHKVVCLDHDPHKIADLQQGKIPIYEPGLDTLITNNAANGRLSFTVNATEAICGADAVFITVGTPPRQGDGDADMSCVFAAAKDIAVAVTKPTVVVTKSTVPVGTGEIIERIIALARPKAEVSVVSNPEFLREGAAISDFQQPDRVVIGTDDVRARDLMMEIYRPLERTRTPILITQRRTAELIKYAANAFLATKISFINEMADLCEYVGSDITDVSEGVGLDHRIGKDFLNAGPGYGGSCFPKDTIALLRTAQDHGVSMRLVEQTVTVNNARKRRMALKVIEAVGGSVAGLTVAVLGLTFKPDTDDMREAPSVVLIEALQRAGAAIKAYDPMGMTQARAFVNDIVFADDPYSCAQNADVVVLVTEWDSLRSLDLKRLSNVMRKPVMVDLRNMYSPDQARRHGFRWVGIGRPHRLRWPGEYSWVANDDVSLDGTNPSGLPRTAHLSAYNGYHQRTNDPSYAVPWTPSTAATDR